MFDTNSHLGRNIAVIVAWIIISCGTMTVFTWYMRRREKRRLYAYATASAATKGKGKASAASLSKVEQGKEKGME